MRLLDRSAVAKRLAIATASHAEAYAAIDPMLARIAICASLCVAGTHAWISAHGRDDILVEVAEDPKHEGAVFVVHRLKCG